MLRAVEAALACDDATAASSVLRTITQAAGGGDLSGLVPALVGLLRAQHDVALLSGDVVRHATVLRLAAGLVDNKSLPVDSNAATELLGMLAASLLHAERTVPPIRTQGGLSTSVEAAAAADAALSRIAAQLRLRSTAAAVLAALFMRIAPAGSVDAASAALRGDVASLFVAVLTAEGEVVASAARTHMLMSPNAVSAVGTAATAAAAAAAGDDGASATPDAKRRRQDDPRSPLAPLPTPSASLYGAAIGLCAVGRSAWLRAAAPVCLHLSAAWAAALDAPAHAPLSHGSHSRVGHAAPAPVALTLVERAWAQQCLAALERAAALWLPRRVPGGAAPELADMWGAMSGRGARRHGEMIAVALVRKPGRQSEDRHPHARRAAAATASAASMGEAEVAVEVGDRAAVTTGFLAHGGPLSL